MECHPVRLAMGRHGCSRSFKVDLAFQLYMHLCEELNAWDVDHSYCPNLDLIYVTARLAEDASVDVFVPVDVNGDLMPQFLTSLQDELGIEGPDGLSKSVKLAMVGADSGVLFYAMTQDVAPLQPRSRKVANAASVLAPAILQHIKDQQEETME